MAAKEQVLPPNKFPQKPDPENPQKSAYLAHTMQGKNPYPLPRGSSTASDPVPQDLLRTLECLLDEEDLALPWAEILTLPNIAPLAFTGCDGSEGTEGGGDILPSGGEESLCACEQSIYWAGLAPDVDCDAYNIRYWYHPDYLGSVEFITDMRGESYQFFVNTPFGENLENQFRSTVTAFSSRFRFNGKELDPETGNYYYGARYYDPKISVWLSVDQLAVLAPNLTPYRFSFNNPVNVVDPDGLFEDKKGAQKAQKKAQNKLGEDRVGDVYYDPDKEEYGYRVYDEGQDKHTRGSSGNGEATVTAYKGQGIYSKKDWNRYKSENGLYTPFVASASLSFFFGGGASFTYGLVQDKFGNQRTFHTWGGGVGVETGGEINYGLIKEKEGYDFRVEDFQKEGFSYGIGIGPFSIKRGGTLVSTGLISQEKLLILLKEVGILKE